ncbi:Very-long-chain 3R-3-hydroxyacyl-CoA dehydratase [Nymphaea thermarum]|nr:Very-long-chain 3R-3-hydroxyacyl-CoA dehydratase [Nymphaea thermarum]
MAGLASGIRRLYLSLYNWAVFAGWLQVLYLAVRTLIESGHTEVYNAVEKPLQLAQTAAVLEVWYDLQFQQHYHRLDQDCMLHGASCGAFLRTHVLVSSLVISWSITEIIRYSFFGMKEAFGSAPSGLLWLRYSTFLVLYPTGITSEVGLIYIALPFIKASDKYCLGMPNKWNFSFDYFYASLLALAIYVPGSPHMYTYMVGQRKKALSKSKKE